MLEQVVVATGGGRVAYIEVGDHVLTQTANVELDAEVSCLDISPIGAVRPATSWWSV